MAEFQGVTSRSFVSFVGVALAVLVIATGAASGAGTTGIEITPANTTVAPGENATYEVVVENASGGVGAYDLSIELENPSAASIVAVEAIARGSGDLSYGPRNASANITSAFIDTNDTGSIPLFRVVTRAGGESARTGVSLSVRALGDERGTSYTVGNVSNASLLIGNETTTRTRSTDPTTPAGDPLGSAITARSATGPFTRGESSNGAQSTLGAGPSTGVEPVESTTTTTTTTTTAPTARRADPATTSATSSSGDGFGVLYGVIALLSLVGIGVLRRRS